MLSILKREDGGVKEFGRVPDYFTDLNLNQIIEEMQGRNKEYNLRPLYHAKVEDVETVRYRQRIFLDIEQKGLAAPFREFMRAMRDTRKRLANYKKMQQEQQKQVCYLGAVSEYVFGLFDLENALKSAAPESEGLQALRAFLSERTGSDRLQACEKQARELNKRLSELSFHIALTEKQMTIATGKKEVHYFDKLRILFPEQYEKQDEGRLPDRYYLESPFESEERLGYLETEAIRVYKKLKPEFFRDVAEFCTKYTDVIAEDLYELESELPFYLAFYDYEKEMQRFGFTFCMPEIRDDDTFSVVEGYDLALARKNTRAEVKTVPNTISYEKGERFFVVTGPNQGGKTTFARSIGQIVYFALLGLPIAAAGGQIPYFDGILTHFSAEESAESGRGKLKEELCRLAPMMRETSKHCFVILNELFTTAATYDAHVMGTRVIRHFISQNCLGIYVTHISELTQGIDGVVSLVALAEGEKQKRRTYRLERRPANGMGYAADIVDRHNLAFDGIVDRLNVRLQEDVKTDKEVWE